jgi:hypothetical protein
LSTDDLDDPARQVDAVLQVTSWRSEWKGIRMYPLESVSTSSYFLEEPK